MILEDRPESPHPPSSSFQQFPLSNASSATALSMPPASNKLPASAPHQSKSSKDAGKDSKEPKESKDHKTQDESKESKESKESREAGEAGEAEEVNDDKRSGREEDKFNRQTDFELGAESELQSGPEPDIKASVEEGSNSKEERQGRGNSELESELRAIPEADASKEMESRDLSKLVARNKALSQDGAQSAVVSRLTHSSGVQQDEVPLGTASVLPNRVLEKRGQSIDLARLPGQFF